MAVLFVLCRRDLDTQPGRPLYTAIHGLLDLAIHQCHIPLRVHRIVLALRLQENLFRTIPNRKDLVMVRNLSILGMDLDRKDLATVLRDLVMVRNLRILGMETTNWTTNQDTNLNRKILAIIPNNPVISQISQVSDLKNLDINLKSPVTVNLQ